MMWRCFHCNAQFSARAKAAEHFGTSEHQQPACLIDVAEYRRMEEAHRRSCEEDTDLHREIYRLQGVINETARREEEKGYARGLQDAAKIAAEMDCAHRCRVGGEVAAAIRSGGAPASRGPDDDGPTLEDINAARDLLRLGHLTFAEFMKDRPRLGLAPAAVNVVSIVGPLHIETLPPGDIEALPSGDSSVRDRFLQPRSAHGGYPGEVTGRAEPDAANTIAGLNAQRGFVPPYQP